MISRAQQILVKRAQREAGLDDSEYRDALALVSGCRSTTDPKMTDRHVDLALAYFEAIYWRGIDAGTLQSSRRPDAVFRHRGHWAARNPVGNTTRDRYAAAHPGDEIGRLESQLAGIGFGAAYVAAIRDRVTHGRTDPHAMHIYRAALWRTLQAKRRAAARRQAPAEF